jgi:hypothetical protein
MCRGRNGRHEEIAPGVNYCYAGATLHLYPEVLYEDCPFARPSDEGAILDCMIGVLKAFADTGTHLAIRRVIVHQGRPLDREDSHESLR